MPAKDFSGWTRTLKFGEVAFTVARFAFSFGAAAFGRGAKGKHSTASLVSPGWSRALKFHIPW